MSSTSNLRDTAVNDFRILANEAITNSLVAFAMDVTGVDNMIYSDRDPIWMSSLKTGAVITGVSWIGANVRNMWPFLNFF